MRKSKQELNPILHKRLISTFCQLIADVKTEDQSKTILGDLLSETELEIVAKRLAVAYWLKKGRSYNNINQNLKVSSATIASVQEKIDSPGYKLALKYIEAEEWANKWAERFKKMIK